MPEKEIKVKIGPNEYTIKFPKTSQLIDIEAAKIRMTGGTIKEMPHGGTSAQSAYLAVESIATFEILIPNLLKDLNVPSLLDLDMQQAQSHLKAYEKYWEWMNRWREVLNADAESKDEKK